MGLCFVLFVWLGNMKEGLNECKGMSREGFFGNGKIIQREYKSIGQWGHERVYL